MDEEQDNNAVYKLVWTIMIVGAILVASAVFWRWRAEPTPVPAAPATENVVEAQEPAESVVVETTRPMNTGGDADLLVRDPGVIDRQAAMLRAQAEASAKSEVGPSRLALTEEQIRDLERKKEILQ
jgi:hypothetical protein